MTREFTHKTASFIRLERPLFGQVARQLLDVPGEDIEECLAEQRQKGGRLGDLLYSRGLITRRQVRQVLKYQARWMARATQQDVQPTSFPFPVSLSVCLPAYNEAANIEDTLAAACAILPEFVKEFELVVVDDGSKDDTAAIVARFADKHPQVRLVRHEVNRGYGAAVSTGLRAARGDLVMFTDSDGQFCLLDLPQLLVNLKGHDAVLGYRYRRADHRMRLFNAWAWNRLIRVVLGVRVRDLDCAFKVFRREVIDRIQLTSTGAAINAEMLTQCVHGGVRFCEVPVNHYPRYAGAPTGAAFKVILRAFRELPQLWKYRKQTVLEPVTVMSEPSLAPV